VAAPFKPLGISVKARFMEGEQYPGGFGGYTACGEPTSEG